jgi:hypothetical protein
VYCGFPVTIVSLNIEFREEENFLLSSQMFGLRRVVCEQLHQRTVFNVHDLHLTLIQMISS